MTTLHVNTLVPVLDSLIGSTPDRKIPWTAIGVFPTEESAGPHEAWWNSFCYTVGMSPGVEMWTPCASIEGRLAGHELTAHVLNHIAAGYRNGTVSPGDTVIVPLGVPGEEDDVDTLWWIGFEKEQASYRQVNMSPADWVIPVLWTSPLGWDEEYVTKSGKVLTEADIALLADEAEQGYDLGGEA